MMDKRRSEAAERRLAEALRANLSRRKAEARARQAGEAQETPPPEEHDEGS